MNHSAPSARRVAAGETLHIVHQEQEPFQSPVHACPVHILVAQATLRMRVLPVLPRHRAELGGTARWDDTYSSCCCCRARRAVRGSGAAGEMLSASEWRLPHKLCSEHTSEEQQPARLLRALAQVLRAASPGQFGCRWQCPRLPKCAAGSASGQGWQSQQRSWSGRAALSKLPWRLPDHRRKSGTPSPEGRPKQFVLLVDFHTPPSPQPGQAG